MANRAGLRKVTKTVRGKKGSVRRSYWVKATGAVKGAAKDAGGFVARHKGKIAGAAALAGAAYLGVKHGSEIHGAVRSGILAHQRNKAMSQYMPMTNRQKAQSIIGSARIGARLGAEKDRDRVNKIGDHVALTGLRATRAVRNAGDHLALGGLRAGRVARNAGDGAALTGLKISRSARSAGDRAALGGLRVRRAATKALSR